VPTLPDPGALMPALPAWLITPLWDQFRALLPTAAPTTPTTPWAATGDAWPTGSSSTCPGAGVRLWLPQDRRPSLLGDHHPRPPRPVITAGIFATLELLVVPAYDQMIGLELGDLAVDGCITKPPAAGMLPGAARSTAETRSQAFNGDRPRHTTGYDGGRRQPQRLAAAGSHPGHPGTPWVTTPAAYGPSGPWL
jgi:hypothetical protein